MTEQAKPSLLGVGQQKTINSVRPPADKLLVSSVKYTCGCGFSTAVIGQAGVHVVSVGHTMFVTGEIVPTAKTRRKWYADAKF